jgi:hypothetical protein
MLLFYRHITFKSTDKVPFSTCAKVTYVLYLLGLAGIGKFLPSLWHRVYEHRFERQPGKLRLKVSHPVGGPGEIKRQWTSDAVAVLRGRVPRSQQVETLLGRTAPERQPTTQRYRRRKRSRDSGSWRSVAEAHAVVPAHGADRQLCALHSAASRRSIERVVPEEREIDHGNPSALTKGS